MSRFARRKDANHGAIVSALKACGCSVEVHDSPTGGAPDLMVGVFGVNVWVEVKDGAKSASKSALNPAQVEWHAAWRGRKPVVVRSVDDALALVAEMRGQMTRSEVGNAG